MFLSSIPLLLNFLRFKDFNDFKENYYKIAEYALNNGNSSIDLIQSNYLDRMFLTLLRPLLL